MLQSFLVRQVLNLAVASIVKLIDKYGHDFDAAKAKIYVKEQIQNFVPASLWGEEFIETGVISVSDFVIDKFAGGILQSSAVVGEVLTALTGKDWAGAINIIKKYIVGLVENQQAVEQFSAQGQDAQSQAFLEVVTKSHGQSKAANPHKGSKTQTEPKAGVETMPE